MKLESKLESLPRWLIISTMAHLVLLFCFRIKMFDFQEQALPLAPISVAIDQDDEGVSAIAAAAPLQKEARIILSTTSYAPFFQETALNLEAIEDDKEIRTLLPKLSPPPPLYPIQLKVTAAPKSLTILDDGTSRLKNIQGKTHYERFLSSGRSTIEYEITVDGQSGKISHVRREKELLDKKLQQYADDIVTNVRFAPYKDTIVTGQLWLTFFCSGEELENVSFE